MSLTNNKKLPYMCTSFKNGQQPLRWWFKSLRVSQPREIAGMLAYVAKTQVRLPRARHGKTLFNVCHRTYNFTCPPLPVFSDDVRAYNTQFNKQSLGFRFVLTDVCCVVSWLSSGIFVWHVYFTVVFPLFLVFQRKTQNKTAITTTVKQLLEEE